MPTKKVAPKKQTPDKFVLEFSDLKLIGQPVHKEFEGAPPAPPPHTATALTRPAGMARQGTASSRGG
jgi:hypothetical protein